MRKICKLFALNRLQANMQREWVKIKHNLFNFNILLTLQVDVTKIWKSLSYWICISLKSTNIARRYSELDWSDQSVNESLFDYYITIENENFALGLNILYLIFEIIPWIYKDAIYIKKCLTNFVYSRGLLQLSLFLH